MASSQEMLAIVTTYTVPVRNDSLEKLDSVEEKGPCEARSLSSPVSHHFGGSWYVIDLHSFHTQAGGRGVGCGHTSGE